MHTIEEAYKERIKRGEKIPHIPGYGRQELSVEAEFKIKQEEERKWHEKKKEEERIKKIKRGDFFSWI